MSKEQVMIGVDLGGTKTDIGIVDSSGKILRHEIIKTDKNPSHIVVDIFNCVKTLENPSEQYIAMGIGMAGQIDAATGLVHFAPNLGWKQFPLAQEMMNRLKIPVKITNDVRAAAWGEWLYGAGKGCQDLICLFVGTGIGAGIVSNGHMLSGSNNAAGEVGHIPIALNGPLCTCGNRGCFEAIAGGWAIARRAKEVAAYDPVEAKKLLNFIGGTIDDLTARNVIEAYKADVSIATIVMEEVKEGLISGVTGLINAFNPAKIILGGGIMNGLPEMIEVIQEGVSTRALKACLQTLEIVPSHLKGEAGVVGAAAFAKT
jgi:glucokinase